MSAPPLSLEPKAARRSGLPSRMQFPAAMAVLLAAVAVSLAFGGQPSTFSDLWHALVTPDSSAMDVTIRELRWPRTLNGLVAGACLGLAGALTQGHTRNPIAEPGLLGINQGAALAIVAVTALSGPPLPFVEALLAFTGALVTCSLVFALGSAARVGATPVTLVLSGAAVSFLAGGLVSGIVLLNEAALDTLRFWQVGSLVAREGVLDSVWPFVLAGAVLAAANIAPLNALALGEDNAVSLGVSVRRSRALGIAGVTLLAGSAVTLAGPIAFAGLLVPHAARAVAGADYRRLIPLSAVLGSALVLFADTAGRLIARPGELSVGVVIAVVGAPLFIHLARRRRLVRL
ncbi:FecCD family ABC transporter permease [Arthrobacter celericrescens]|uniref:FecCD family ABC transporter permease n=1 Tax=Arthrobacter celericrescens TaxID=2320851 RepID=UPI001FE1CDB3|nr:iron ABC transporter permease [Arthrobacter celericrescens]